MFSKYVTSTHEITDAYRDILLNAQEAKVRIEPSDGGSTTVFLFEKKRRPYECFVQNGTLTVRPKKAKWNTALRIALSRAEIKLCIPASILGNLSARANTGSIDISAIECSGDIDLQTNTSKVTVCDVRCRAFHSKGNTGSIALNNLKAEDEVNIKRGTGKVLLNGCNAAKFFVKTNTGRVGGHLPLGTVFAVRTHTGKIEVPENKIGEAVGAICEIKTNTGRVKFE